MSQILHSSCDICICKRFSNQSKIYIKVIFVKLIKTHGKLVYSQWLSIIFYHGLHRDKHRQIVRFPNTGKNTLTFNFSTFGLFHTDYFEKAPVNNIYLQHYATLQYIIQKVYTGSITIYETNSEFFIIRVIRTLQWNHMSIKASQIIGNATDFQ